MKNVVQIHEYSDVCLSFEFAFTQEYQSLLVIWFSLFLYFTSESSTIKKTDAVAGGYDLSVFFFSLLLQFTASDKTES